LAEVYRRRNSTPVRPIPACTGSKWLTTAIQPLQNPSTPPAAALTNSNGRFLESSSDKKSAGQLTPPIGPGLPGIAETAAIDD
jgi:hypothetical protein